MGKKCARCDKTVYPIEELKCLDKVWHKGCFKCQECGMTLSMKTYKGFNKLPYCEAHIPKAKATTVADALEFKRIAENTKIQSNVQYHAEFERNKAKFTQIADDPETLRLKANTKIISNVSYHGELEKKAEMERKRSEPENGNEEVSENLSNSVQPQPQHQQQQQSPSKQAHQRHSHHQQTQVPVQQHHQHHEQRSQHYPTHAQNAIPPSYHQTYQPQQQQQLQQQHHPQMPPYPHQNLIHDPNHNSPYSARTSQTLIYTSQTGPVHQQPICQVGSIADYDPLNDHYGSLTTQSKNNFPRTNLYGESGQQQQFSAHHKMNHPPTQLGRCYRAVYDYEAADMDEVSFHDGDYIINCTPIDEGWMTGTVQRTGHTGMLPANYVERLS